MSAARPWYHDMVTRILARYDRLREHQIVPAKQGSLLLLPPVQHCCRYLFLAKRSAPKSFRLGNSVFLLFEAADSLHQSFAHDLPDPSTGHRGGFVLDSPDLPGIIDRATDFGIREIQAVENLATCRDYIDRVAAGSGPLANGKIWLAAALGDFDGARKLVKAKIDAFGSATTVQRTSFDVTQVQRLQYSLDESPGAVLALLRENEQHNVRMLKLEKYWQPTPFPFEVAGS